MTFKPGQSGNPGGRPKGLHRPTELARERTEEAVETLVAIMREEEASSTARTAAAGHLLDRGWGKAAQPVDLAGNGLERFTDAELAMLEAFVEAQLGLDGEATDGAVH
jgi:hypothetical protein